MMGYKASVKRISAVIGDVEVQKLRPRDIDMAITFLANQNLSKGTLEVTLNALKDALNYAIYPCEFISNNPAALIKVPKFAPKKVIKREVIDGEKLKEIFDALPFGNPLHIPLQIAYHTGMRIGETLGLCWDCVDLKRGIIRVIRQIKYTPDIGYYFSEPKTSTSVRPILLDNEIIDILQRWRKEQLKNKLAVGASYFIAYEDEKGRLWHFNQNTDVSKDFTLRSLVCTDKRGKALNENVICIKLQALGTNSHSLRHTHATMLIEGGAIPKDVATILGHADATITQNLYTHDTEEMQRDTLRIFEKMLAMR